MPGVDGDQFKMFVWYCNFGWNDRARVILPGLNKDDAIERYKGELARLGWKKDELIYVIEHNPPDEEENLEGWFYVEYQRDD